MPVHGVQVVLKKWRNNMSNVKTQIQQVTEFMKVGGQDVNTIPTFVSYAIAQLRHSLISEEITGHDEFQYCAERDNLVGALDGMCDILYVTYGTALAYGIDITNRTAPTTANGQVVPAHITYNTISTLIYDLNLYNEGFKSGRMSHIEESLNRIVSTVYNYAESIKVDLAGAFNEVHESNMSKFSETEEHAVKSAEHRLFSGDEKYRHVHSECVTVDGKDYWMIKRNSDGKILKSLNFFEPELAKYVK